MRDIAEQVRQIVARSFSVETTALSDRTTADDVEGWDSLAHATLILRLQKIFDIRLDAAKASSAQDLGRLTALIAETLMRETLMRNV